MTDQTDQYLQDLAEQRKTADRYTLENVAVTGAAYVAGRYLGSKRDQRRAALRRMPEYSRAPLALRLRAGTALIAVAVLILAAGFFVFDFTGLEFVTALAFAVGGLVLRASANRVIDRARRVQR